ncbi:AMP-binding protein [Streptomyces sp. NPDC001833]|uniref:AMP-binding protein n=1 Tax=Streptomyces sp. NPDC001833 TaxID=3154658 RepID=UPI0033271624
MSVQELLPVEQRTLGGLLSQRAADHPDQDFLVTEGRSWTYREFDEWVTQLAGGLVELGLGKGDKLAIMLPNVPEFMGVWFACARLGIIEVPVNTAYRGLLLRHVIENSDAKAAVIGVDYLDRFEHEQVGFGKLEHLVLWSADTATPSYEGSVSFSAFSALEVDDPALPEVSITPTDTMAILYSSGTTGPSKGIVLSHNYFWFGGSRSAENGRLVPEDRLYTCLPLFHANAQLVTVMPALAAGAAVVIDDRFTASGFWKRLRHFRATRFAYIGGMIPILMKQPPSPDDRDHTVKWASGGAAPKDLHLAFEERFGLRILEGYGQTENCVALTNPIDAPRVGSLGKAICGYDLEIVGDDDEFLGPNQVGELVFRPQQPYIMMDGYYKMPEATLAASRNLWFHTGDLMWKDKDGYFYFVDRKKDALRRRGENISAYEVEMVVNTHPAVLESAAIAVPSEVGEDEVMVCVVLRPGVTLPALDLIKHCESLMPYFSVPRYVDFRDALPKTPTLRVEKYRLREQGITPTTWDREASGYQLKR